jgi:hypothetical protein
MGASMREDGTVFLALVVGAAVWLSAGNGWLTVKGWFGQQSYEDQVAALEAHVKSNKIGNDSDMWLVTRNMFGDHEKVALIFGYWGDEQACNEYRELYTQRYPASEYYCQPAN